MTKASRGAPRRSAAEWFAVMHGPDAEAERPAFEAWRREPANLEAYARLETTWSESRFLANRSAARGRDLARARKRASTSALIAASAALVTVVSASLLVQQMGWMAGPSMTHREAVRIAASERVRTIRLADGSRVTLDRDSELGEHFTASERRIVLVRGRARFEVAHDAARPFLVEAVEGQVLAHGTLFDVGIEEGRMRVALLRGSVEVIGRAGRVQGRRARRFLAPGEQLLVEAGSVGKPSPVTATALAWADPMISFDGAPLAQAVAAFNGGGGRAVKLENDALSGFRVSGSFRRDDPRGFADALAATFGLTVKQDADGSLVLSARGGRAGEPPVKKSQG